MTHVLHLLRHDLRAHRTLLLAWVGIVIAHPLLAAVPWGDVAASLVWVLGATLVAARVSLAAAVVAAIAQHDSPFDDRSFWRTRPIPPATMAAGKLVLAASIFVCVPLLVVLAVAMALRVPLTHWPSTIAQVLVHEGAWLGLACVAGTCTRRVASALVAIPATLIALFGLLVVASEARIAAWPSSFRQPDPEMALPTMLAVATATLWTMSAIAWHGRRRRSLLAGLGAGGMIALLTVWFLPGARLHRREEPGPGVALQLSRDVRAMLHEADGRVALLTTASVPGWPAQDVSGIYLRSGVLTRGNDLYLRVRVLGEVGSRSLPVPSNATLLGVLSRDEYTRLAGQRVHFSGRFGIEIRRERQVAIGRLQPGTAIRAAHGRLNVHGVATPTPDAPAIASGTALWMNDATRRPDRLANSVAVIDERDARPVGAYQRPHPSAQISRLVLLPTIARPFGWWRLDVAIGADHAVPLDPEAVRLELINREQPTLAHVVTGLAFAMPNEVTRDGLAAGDAPAPRP